MTKKITSTSSPSIPRERKCPECSGRACPFVGARTYIMGKRKVTIDGVNGWRCPDCGVEFWSVTELDRARHELKARLVKEGRLIQYLRICMPWTLDEMRQRTGISKAMLNAIERGTRKPSLGNLKALSDCLHEDINTLALSVGVLLPWMEEALKKDPEKSLELLRKIA